MFFKKSAKFIRIIALTAILTSGTFARNLFAYDSDVPQNPTNLCSHCDNWFINEDNSKHLCPRCELLKDLVLLKSDPDFNAEKLDPQKEYARREIEEKINTLEQSIWAKPDLRWTNTY